MEKMSKWTKRVLLVLLTALMVLPLGMVSAVGTFDAARVIYAEDGAISVEGVTAFHMIPSGVSFEIPAGLTKVTIIPLVDNAFFEYLGVKYCFGKISADTIGVLTLAAEDVKPKLTITPSFWADWPSWAQWMLEYVLFGWIWMRWF
jgi:hypothetical protein